MWPVFFWISCDAFNLIKTSRAITSKYLYMIWNRSICSQGIFLKKKLPNPMQWARAFWNRFSSVCSTTVIVQAAFSKVKGCLLCSHTVFSLLSLPNVNFLARSIFSTWSRLSAFENIDILSSLCIYRVLWHHRPQWFASIMFMSLNHRWSRLNHGATVEGLLAHKHIKQVKIILRYYDMIVTDF